MATTSDVKVTPGSGANVATYAITEDAETKKIQRVVLNSQDGVDLGTAALPVQSTIRNSSGTEIGTSANPIRVDLASSNTVIATQPTGTNLHTVVDSGTLTGVTTVTTVSTVSAVAAVTPGTAAGNLGKAEDAAHTSGDTGVMSLAVRNDAGGALAGTTGDYIPLTTDSTGALRVTGTGSTQYVEDAASASGDTGTMMLAVRHDANTTQVSYDGDYAALQQTSDGALKVAITSGAGSGGTSIADAASFTIASTSITPIGGIYEASVTALADGKVGIVELDSSRNMMVHEQYAPLAEDNTNQVIATQSRPVSGSTYSPTLYAPMTQVTKANLKASAGNVFSIYISNDNAAVRFFQLHNKATAPAGTDVPLISVKVPAGTANNPGVLILDETFFTRGGRYFTTGIGWALSTTFATFTDSGTNTESIVVINYL